MRLRAGDGAFVQRAEVAGRGAAAAKKFGEALANVDGDVQFSLDTVDACVDPAHFGDELRLRRVELDHDARVEAVDLLVDDRDLVTESLIERGNRPL